MSQDTNEVIDLTLLSSDEEDEVETEVHNEIEYEEEDSDTVAPIDDESLAQLLAAIETVSEARLRSILANLIDTNDAVQRALFNELVIVPAQHQEQKRRRAEPVVSRYVACANCDEEFDIGQEREEGECRYHPGQSRAFSFGIIHCTHTGGFSGDLSVDYESFVDWDEDCHGPMDTSSNRREYPENFLWSCCDRDGTTPGCVSNEHTVGNKRRRI